LPIHYATFMGLRWWLRVVYSLLSMFGRKNSPVLGKNLTILGINRGLKLNFKFYNPKRHIIAWFHVFWAIAHKKSIHGSVTCRLIKEKKVINKNNFCYISPICPEAPNEWICTKFGIGGPLTDIINCANFFVDWFRGIDFVGVEICPIGIEGRR